MGMISRLDDLVTRIGLYPRVTQPPRQRHMRWLPVAALILWFAGAAMVLLGDVSRPSVPLVIVGGLLLSTWMPLFGPMKPWGSPAMDEYDRQVRWRALTFAYGACTMFALLAFVVIAVMARDETLGERKLFHALLLSGGTLLVLKSVLPTLHVSWTTRRPEDGGEGG